jgi:hypothetical protein
MSERGRESWCLTVFDAFTGNEEYCNAAKLDSVTWYSEKIRELTSGSVGSWPRSVEAWAAANRDDCERDFSMLNQAQRGWLAKGLRDWSNYISNASTWLAIELQRAPNLGLFDLKTFLYRRQLRGMERGTRWARWTKRNVSAWLRRLGDALLERLAERLRGNSRPKALLALLKAPPGWAAARVYLDFQITLPRLVERLIEVQAPNAPSLSPGHLCVLGGNVA